MHSAPLEFHYVPKHASWLNMVEIEIGVLAGRCLDRRIDSYVRLFAEIVAWEKRRNAERARINRTLEALTERQPCRPHRGGDARQRAPLMTVETGSYPCQITISN